MRRSTYVGICAGAGLGCEGMRRAGYDCRLLVEFDELRQAVLRRRFPGVRIEKDLSVLDGTNVPRVDVWLATLPCQSYSAAGRRRGLADARGQLVFAFARVLGEARRAGCGPRAIIWENVPGWLSSGAGADAQAAIAAIREAGYSPVAGSILNSLDFGVPQSRDRVIVIFGGPDFRLDVPIVTPPALIDASIVESCKLSTLPLRFLDAEILLEQARELVTGRVLQRSGEGGTWDGLTYDMLAYVGMLDPPPHWEHRVVVLSGKNPRCFAAGYCPTLTKEAQLQARLTDGRLFRLTIDAYEFFMGVELGFTAEGLDPKGELLHPRDADRFDMCGDGLVVQVAEAVAMALKPWL